MAVADEIVDELKAAIQTARKRPMAFGLCLGKSPEETVLVTHRTKDPEALEREAKKQGTTPKLVSGTLEVAGKNMTLTCIGQPPAAAARQLRAFLKEASLPLKVILMDADGNLLEDSGDEEEGDGSEAEGTAEEVTPGPDLAAKWQQALQRLTPAVRTFLASGAPQGQQLGVQLKAAVAVADGGDHAAALAALPAIVEILRAAPPPLSPPGANPPPPVTSPQPVVEDPAKAKAETAQRLSSLLPDLRKLQSMDAATFAALGPDVARLRALAAEGRTDEAQDLADEIEQQMAATLPPSFVGLQKLRLRWQDGKKAAETQLAALRQALLAEYDDAEAQQAAAQLDLVLGRFNEGLTDRLDDMLNATAGEARNALKAQALSIAADYGAYVATSPLIGLVEDNPYLPVSVRLALLQPLQLLEVELAKAGA